MPHHGVVYVKELLVSARVRLIVCAVTALTFLVFEFIIIKPYTCNFEKNASILDVTNWVKPFEDITDLCPRNLVTIILFSDLLTFLDVLVRYDVLVAVVQSTSLASEEVDPVQQT